MSKLNNLLPIAIGLLLFCCRLASAQDEAGFEAARLKAAAANPPGVTLILSLPGGRTQFHRGEMIPLSAVFTNTSPNKYDLNTDPGNRDLQWNSDSFHVDHSAGAADPLPVYYDHEFGEGYSGGGPQFQPLTASPVAIPYTLNEWLRFDAPGHYRVYLTSGRIIDTAKRQQNTLWFLGCATVSNAVEVDILPDDPIWDAQTLQAALPLYNAQGYNSRTDAAQQAAIRTVRFLDTPDAARTMIARYSTFSDFDFANARTYNQTQLGLFGFQQPDFVISEMKRRISKPDFPISEQFISDLAQVQFLAAYTQTIPRYVAGDPAQEKERRDLIQKRLAALTALQEQDRQLLKAAASAKQGKARSASLYALVMLDYQHQNTPEYQNQARALVPVFDDLTTEQQDNLLGYNWEAIRGPNMLPVLRRLYAAPPPADSGSPEVSDAADLHSLALRRLMELSPAEGRALLLAEIKSASPSVDLPTLCSLPDRTLPALDGVLAAHLESLLSNEAGDWSSAPCLVERYATSAILPRVKAAYGSKSGEWGCDIQSSLLAYFLRTDRAYGVMQLEKALASRKDTGCYRSVLSDVAALQASPDIERLAVAHLNDPDTEVAADAAKTLGAYGSSAAEAPLWARMRVWHSQWAGKEAQIEPTDAHPAWVQGELEYALLNSLATSRNWLLDKTQLQALDQLCVTRGAHQNVEGFLQDWAETVRISRTDGPDPWQVVQYHSIPTMTALETKLAQFPRGTRFQLSPFGFTGHAQQTQAFVRLRPFLEKRGMQLKEEPFPPR
jgi:HPt (histidine-containing phosphotransfer) domain-containing protein